MTDTPVGFAPVFPGWNVWSVYQSTDPDNSIFGDIMNAGMSLDRQLQVWVENEIKDNAPGTAVADPANPAALRGDQIQIVPGAGSLAVAFNRREQLPEFAGDLHLGKAGTQGNAPLRFVRFFNRGVASVMPWPRDQNYILESVFQPSSTNPITNAPAPSSLGGAATDAANAIGNGLETIAWIAGGAAVLLILMNLRRK